MKPAFSVLVVAALLIGSSSAEAARGTAAGHSNLMRPSTPPISSTPLTPLTNPVGGVGITSPSFTPQTNPIGGAGTFQSLAPSELNNPELNNPVTGTISSP